MQNSNGDRFNVLAIAPVDKGFGFVFMRDRHTLLDWGTRSVKRGDKNKKTLIAVEKLVERFEPESLVLPDAFKKGSRRQERIRKLVRRLMTLGKRRGITVELISKEQLQSFFFGGGHGTKHGVAKKVADRFPEEIGDFLPPERQQWMSENHFMRMFDAAALALASFNNAFFTTIEKE
jgi:hypothetical protein